MLPEKSKDERAERWKTDGSNVLAKARLRNSAQGFH